MVKNQYLASKLREHLNSVGYKLGLETEKLMKQVLEIDGQTWDETQGMKMRVYVEIDTELYDLNKATLQTFEALDLYYSYNGNLIHCTNYEVFQEKIEKGVNWFVQCDIKQANTIFLDGVFNYDDRMMMQAPDNTQKLREINAVDAKAALDSIMKCTDIIIHRYWSKDKAAFKQSTLKLKTDAKV